MVSQNREATSIMANLKLYVIAALAAVSATSTSARAAETAEQMCADVNQVVRNENQAVMNGNPELAYGLMQGISTFNAELAGKLGTTEEEAFARCVHRGGNSRALYRYFNDHVNALNNACPNGQTFVFGHGCLSNDAAAIIDELKQR
jgi:hypothetical protein